MSFDYGCYGGFRLQSERLFRIGNKLVSLEKTFHVTKKALELREQGYSQQETSDRLKIDRSFISRNNNERWEMVQDKQALDFFNSMLELLTQLRKFDLLVMITSQKWYHLAEALLDIQIIHLDLGPTPIEEDCLFEQKRLETILDQII